MIEISPEIERIKEILPKLSPNRLKEAVNFINLLYEKELKHLAFVAETLASLEQPAITCHSVDELIQAILNVEDN